MKSASILYKLTVLTIIAFVMALVSCSGFGFIETYSTLAVVGLFGSLEISKDTDTAGKVIFDSILEDWPGGAVLYRSRLKTGTTEIGAGTLLYINDGVAQIVKTAAAITGGSATAIRVGKNHQFKVDEFIMLTSGAKAQKITSITTTEATYDTIAIGTSLGSTPGTGDILVEATAETQGTDSAQKYVANAVLRDTVNVERANPTCSGVVRGSVREDAVPYSVHALDKTALKLIRFV